MKKTMRYNQKTARVLAALLCAALLLALAACGDSDDGVTLKEGTRFTVAVSQTPDSLNPMASQGGLAEEFFLLCYDPLWRLDENGEPEACLAEDWSLSSDRLTWTIRLRRDAVFSDGVPVTAADVLFSYELMRRSDTAYAAYFDGVTAIRSTDDYTVVISTEYVKGDMTYNQTPILPRHIWKDYEFAPASFDNADLVGSGPFVYDAAGSGEEGWLFRARSDHFDGAPEVGEIYFAYYSTVPGAARALSAGEADASFGLTDVQLTTLENVPGVELIRAMAPAAECQLLVFNLRSVFFGREGFRQGAEYCCDREWFLAMSVGGAGATGSSFLSPGAGDFIVPDGLRGFDTGRMADVLRSAGYADMDGDGYLEYGTRQTKLTLSLWSSSRDSWSSTAATILVDDLTQIGVRVNWHKTDQAITDVCRGDDSWDMCLMSWKGGCGTAVTARRFLQEIGGEAGWSSEDFENTLALMRAAEDASVARGYARQLQQLAYNDCPAVVLTYAVDIQGIREDGWTGYEDLLGSGGLFGVGSRAVYMLVTPRTVSE